LIDGVICSGNKGAVTGVNTMLNPETAGSLTSLERDRVKYPTHRMSEELRRIDGNRKAGTVMERSKCVYCNH